jgi:hypothetical protein
MRVWLLVAAGVVTGLGMAVAFPDVKRYWRLRTM